MSKVKRLNKAAIFSEIRQKIEDYNLTIIVEDDQRPWGGFFLIDENDTDIFIKSFFSELEIGSENKISPKILIVEPNKRLSWQYHHRRAEVWKVLRNRVGVIRSKTDEQAEVEELTVGDTIILEQGERHRLVGLNDYAVIAEIWQHTDPHKPSTEDDIIRLEDDFGR